jgi:hypothetical protein
MVKQLSAYADFLCPFLYHGLFYGSLSIGWYDYDELWIWKQAAWTKHDPVLELASGSVRRAKKVIWNSRRCDRGLKREPPGTSSERHGGLVSAVHVADGSDL